tara:strand:- start:589 stop:894 length:306 start_codon:yes stop_codon:yes gene_type:complete
MLKEFVALLDTDESLVDIKELLSPADKRRWLKMLEVFENIQIHDIPNGIRFVEENFKFNKTEEVTILAYIKFLELMVDKVAKVNDIKKSTKKNVSLEMMYG